MHKAEYIYLVAIGNVHKRLLFASAKNVKEVFGPDVRVSSVPAYYPNAYNLLRGQFVASKVLDRIRKVELPRALRILGLTDVDIYEGELNFVFGIAELGGCCALVSIHRLQHEDERMFFERVFKEINHELGHTFGLLHCQNPNCVMSFSNSVYEVDRKSKDFCQRCKAKLRDTYPL